MPPKIPDNFFKLKLIHPVITEFYEWHVKSMKLYTDSYQQISIFDDESAVDNYEVRVSIITRVRETHDAMEELFNNFLMSYYAFRKLAETDTKVAKEFKKIPDKNFEVAQKHLVELIEVYEDAEKLLRVIL